MLKFFRRKLVYIAVLGMLSLPVGANAFLPFLLPMIGVTGGLATYIEASIWFHVAAAGALCWYHNRANNVKTVDSNGNIRSDAAVTWVSWDANGNPVVMEGQATARIGATDLKGVVLKDAASKAKYPLLAAKMEGVISKEPGQDDAVGTLYSHGGQYYQVTAKGGLNTESSYNMTSSYNPAWTPSGAPTSVTYNWGGTCDGVGCNSYSGSQCYYRTYSITTITNPPKSPYAENDLDKHLSQAQQDANAGTPLATDPSLNGDIDQVLKDLANDQSPGFNIVHFEDGTPTSDNNPPLMPPASADPSAVQGKVGNWTKPGSTGSTGYSAPGSGASGNTSGTGTYGGAGTTGPTGSGGTGANTGSGSGTGSSTPGSTPPPPTPMGDPGSSPGRKTTLSFDSWNGMKDKVSNIGPFAFLGEAGHSLDNLVADPVAPSFDIPVYGDLKIPVNLSVYDPVAAVLRYMEAAAMSVGCIFFAVKFWRGVS